MEINRFESAKFAQAADAAVEKLEIGVADALSKSAAKGFPAAPGPILAFILGAYQEAKNKLVEANGKTYDDRRNLIFQQQEFLLKLAVRVAKLSFESYREALLNALALEQAEQEGVNRLDLADVDRLNTETERRQVAIIQAKAEIEQRINVYRGQLVEKETESLDLERALIQAQLQTAEKKLEIINSIYQVLAAEQLVLAAERRRAASLAILLEAQERIAAIKQEMVPYYLDKASARELLADAVTQDAAVREAIEKLGYDKIDLQTTQEYVEHLIRDSQEEYELAQDARVRAEKAVELARAQARRVLQEYSNQVQEEILERKLELEKDGVTFKLSNSLARVNMTTGDEVELVDYERGNLSLEIINLLENMEDRANDQATTIRDSAFTKTETSQLNASITRKILAG